MTIVTERYLTFPTKHRDREHTRTVHILGVICHVETTCRAEDWISGILTEVYQLLKAWRCSKVASSPRDRRELLTHSVWMHERQTPSL
jgi:hypothetical protein